MRVIPALDEGEYGLLRLGRAAESTALQQFALEGGKETLGQRVIEAIADRAH